MRPDRGGVASSACQIGAFCTDIHAPYEGTMVVLEVSIHLANLPPLLVLTTAFHVILTKNKLHFFRLIVRHVVFKKCSTCVLKCFVEAPVARH